MTDSGALDSGELAAWRSFVEMHHLLERHLGRHLQADFGLSNPDFEVLVNLSEAPGGRMRAFELGRGMQWEKSRISHHLTRMEKRGLVRRESVGTRHHEIVLTDAGRAAIQSSAPANAARVREFFVDALGPQRLGAMKEASDEVIATIREHLRDDCALDG